MVMYHYFILCSSSAKAWIALNQPKHGVLWDYREKQLIAQFPCMHMEQLQETGGKLQLVKSECGVPYYKIPTKRSLLEILLKSDCALNCLVASLYHN